MTKQSKRVKRYNKYATHLKRKIAKSYLAGEASYAVLAEEHGLRDKTVVKEFVKWYKVQLAKATKTAMPEQDEIDNSALSIEQLRTQNAALQEKTRLQELKIEGLQTLIDLATERYNIDILKKSATKPSGK